MTQPTENLGEDGVGGVGDEQATAGVPEPSLDAVRTANAEDEISLTDTGNGRRMVELYGSIIRYVEDTDQWIVRRQVHWAPDPARLAVFSLTQGVTRDIRREAMRPHTNEDARDSMLAYAVKTESEQTRWRMISTAREHTSIVITEEDIDHDPDLLAVPDGVVNLKTGEWREARSDDLCTQVTSVTYDPDATSPLLDQYLETFVPEPDDQRVLFAILGTILRGGNPGRLFPIFLGGTTSGKSQLLAALDKLLGEYICSINASVFRGNLDDKPRPDLVRAMYKRIAYAVEASKIWELHADQVKRITGGDSVPYRNLYSQSAEKIPRFTPLIVTNEMPRIKGSDQALKRRMIVFTFDKTLPPALEDTRIKERFINDENCQRSLLARIVAGARDELLRDGIRWTMMPSKYATATLESFGQLDHVDEFIEWLKDREILQIVDMTETPVSHCAKANELHEWYGLWVKKHGDRQDKNEALNMKDFGAALRERGWASKLSGGTRWLGVKLSQSPGLLNII